MWLIIKVVESSGAAVLSDKFQECEDFCMILFWTQMDPTSKPFEAVHGEITTKADRPSLGPAAEQHDQANKAVLVSTKAHMTVTCSQCEKPKVVYSPLRLEPGVETFLF